MKSGGDAPKIRFKRTAPASANAIVFGCAGPTLSGDERAFFAEARPVGFILFARNVVTPEQVRRLVADLREAVGWRAPVLIDQEGGRVARLRPPNWSAFDPVGMWAEAVDAGRRAEEDLWEALALRARLIADDLTALGVDVNCGPVLDLRLPGRSDVVGDRGLGPHADRVAARGRVLHDATLAGGVLPVIKHAPGHGRAVVDSHAGTPRVDVDLTTLTATDFAPFRALSDALAAMTCHVVFDALDPERPATLSPAAIAHIRGAIGFDGLLFSDDLGMGALDGAPEQRVAGCLAAGCDVALHCGGDLDAMRSAVAGAAPITPVGRRRLTAALAAADRADPFDRPRAEARLRDLVDGRATA